MTEAQRHQIIHDIELGMHVSNFTDAEKAVVREEIENGYLKCAEHIAFVIKKQKEINANEIRNAENALSKR